MAILVSQNNETAAMLVSQTIPLGVELLSYANTFFVPTNLRRCRPRQWKHSIADITVVTIKCVQVGTGVPGFSLHWGVGVALQLCPPLQFGPLTYQPIECVFISSNQSALWSCPLSVTSQLGEGCGTIFVRFVFLILWKTWVWNSFAAFSPMGFWRILQKCEVCSKLSSLNAYVYMLES